MTNKQVISLLKNEISIKAPNIWDRIKNYPLSTNESIKTKKNHNSFVMITASICIICVLVAVPFLFADNLSDNSNDGIGKSSLENGQTGGNDYTIKVREFDINPFKSQIEKLTPIISSPSFSVSCESLDELLNNSKYVIEGTVQNVSFTTLDATPYTKIDVLINQSFKGVFKKGDIITVMQFGGYLTLAQEIDVFGDAHFGNISREEQEKTIIEKKLTDEEYPVANDSFVMFLDNDDTFKGAYVLCNDYQGRFKHKDDKYVRYGEYVNGTNTLTIQEIKNAVASSE